MTAPARAQALPLWRGIRSHRLVWRDWGDESVVFDSESGLTHLLSPLAAAAMGFFEQHVGSIDDLTQALAGDLGVPADNELRDALVPVMELLRRLDWIVPADPR